MKKIMNLLLTASLLFMFNYSFSQITTTENFQHFTISDGLISNDITDVLIQDNSNLWIATSTGLSHYDGITFTNYTNLNSAMLNNNLKELVFTQNKIWMVSDSGLTSFDGTSFVNYTTSNGLLSSSIEGVAATSTDTLWITTLNGTSKFDGVAFTHYNTQTGRDVEVDNMDRVYVMRTSIANNFPFVRLYENGTWSLPAPTGISFGVSGAKLSKTNEGNLFVGGLNNANYIKINYPLNLDKKTVYFDSNVYVPGSGVAINLQQLEEKNNLTFIGGGGNVPLYHVSADSNFVRQYAGAADAISSCFQIKGNLMVIGSDRGVFLSKPTVKSTITGLPFSVNQISTTVSMTDPLFSNVLTSSANFEFPKNSNSHGIYSANFIVAAKKSNQNNYVVHPNNGFVQAFNPGPINNTGGLSDRYMFRLTKAEILNHQTLYNQPGYIMPEGIRDWPSIGDTSLGVAIDLAPFVDANNNGCYDPQNGDYPIIKGDEAIYWINHPINNNLELEYHWMMYAFSDTSNNYLDQSIFLQYTIVNRSIDAYDSLKIGFYLDADLGNPADDYVGSDSLSNLLYVYNGDNFDESVRGFNGYGNQSPALGVKFLSDSLDNSMYYNIGSGVNGDPITTQDWLNYLNSRWKNGQSITYGGDGYNSSGTTTIPTSYMFTGEPSTNTGWTEITPLGGQSSNAPGDRRILGSIPYFALQPQGRKTIEIAVGYGRTNDTSNVIGKNVPEMRRILNEAGRFWDTLTVPTANFASNDSCSTITSVQEVNLSDKGFSIFPVPAQNRITVESSIVFDRLEVYDMKGSLVYSIMPVQNRLSFDVSILREGIYFLNAYSEGNVESKKFAIIR